MDLGKKIFVIYPVKSQLFHMGNKEVYNYLVTKYGGNEVYITTTDTVQPFNSDERSKMAMLTGVPLNRIIKTKNAYNPRNLAGQIPININRDSVIFAVDKKDLVEHPYLQPVPKRLDKLQPAIANGYVDVVPTTIFTVLGMPVRNESQLKKQYISLSPQQRKQFIRDLFGKYDESIYTIMNNKFGTTTDELTEKQKKLLKKLIVGVLKEDEAKVKNMKKLADMALQKQRQAELDDANQKLDSAKAQQDAAVSDEDKKKGDEAVEKAKDVVKRADLMLQAAKHQVQST
jgi:hypothetical protein